ncbi:MAG: helix-turn-helix domain-containing protein [Bacillales bacterium]|jgi:transcriptional regulator with XRE-family HTH domain|nr:helix-turn-helix domain-containing protein [Bacillales bacterium]
MTIGKKIELLRRNRGLTQADLAEKLSFTRQAIQKWETSQTTPDIYTIPKIADIFKVSVDTLLSETISEEDLIKESLGLDKAKEKKTTNFNSSSNIIYLPIAIILTAFIGFGWFFIFLFICFGLLSPLIDVGILGLSIYELIVKEGIGYILISVGGIILAVGLFFPSLLLMKLTYKEYKNIFKYCKKMSTTFMKKLFK